MAIQKISVKFSPDDDLNAPIDPSKPNGPKFKDLYSKYIVYATLEDEVSPPTPPGGKLKKYTKVDLKGGMFDLGYIDTDTSDKIVIQIWIEIKIGLGYYVSESKYTKSISWDLYDNGSGGITQPRKNYPIRIKIEEKPNGYGTLNRIVQPGWPATPESKKKRMKK